jgi:hypothetical protein
MQLTIRDRTYLALALGAGLVLGTFPLAKAYPRIGFPVLLACFVLVAFASTRLKCPRCGNPILRKQGRVGMGRLSVWTGFPPAECRRCGLSFESEPMPKTGKKELAVKRQPPSVTSKEADRSSRQLDHGNRQSHENPSAPLTSTELALLPKPGDEIQQVALIGEIEGFPGAIRLEVGTDSWIEIAPAPSESSGQGVVGRLTIIASSAPSRTLSRETLAFSVKRLAILVQQVRTRSGKSKRGLSSKTGQLSAIPVGLLFEGNHGDGLVIHASEYPGSLEVLRATQPPEHLHAQVVDVTTLA